MPGFTATPAAPIVPVVDIVAGDGWWPDLSLAAFKQSVRLPGTVTDARAREALIGGVISAQVELDAWSVDQTLLGVASLAAVILLSRAGVAMPAIDNQPRALVLYRRAVHAFAAADLAETHDDITATDTGRMRNEERAAGAPELLRTATLAIRDLLGKRRSKVALL